MVDTSGSRARVPRGRAVYHVVRPISPCQSRVLAMLEQWGGGSIPQIARALDMPSTTVAGAVRVLEERHFVTSWLEHGVRVVRALPRMGTV